MKAKPVSVALILVLCVLALGGRAPLDAASARRLLSRLIGEDEAARATSRVGILDSRDRTLIPALVDALFFATAAARIDVVACLEGLSGETLGGKYRYWVEYLGGHEEIRPKEGYRAWKAALFSRIDPAFGQFLDPKEPLRIRPEEIIWGGVKKDGIPALEYPKNLPASRASFLNESEIVFGIGVNGEYRAYPQRILDWHEMANDTVGGQAFALSYCTLCGSAVAYATRLSDGRTLLFGSSGLLYRSNKLMYDEQTLSLWSNLTGEPVSGPLTDKGVRLPMLPMTVTSWGEWRSRHPETTVVSLETGYRRDYSAGAAYGKYFESPETMFPVWKRNGSLEAKSWIFALRDGVAARAYPLETLFRERVVNDAVGRASVVLVADPQSGAVRAYEREGKFFAEGPSPEQLVEEATGTIWTVEEEALHSASPGRPRLLRFPGHRAYWFGWYAFFPDTSLYEGCVPGLLLLREEGSA